MAFILLGILCVPAMLFGAAYANHVFSREWYGTALYLSIIFLGLLLSVGLIGFGSDLLNNENDPGHSVDPK